jgi:hypothetical protein
MIWGSDYPHSESTFPQSRKILAEILAGVSDAIKSATFGKNSSEGVAPRLKLRSYGFLPILICIASWFGTSVPALSTPTTILSAIRPAANAVAAAQNSEERSGCISTRTPRLIPPCPMFGFPGTVYTCMNGPLGWFHSTHLHPAFSRVVAICSNSVIASGSPTVTDISNCAGANRLIRATSSCCCSPDKDRGAAIHSSPTCSIQMPAITTAMKVAETIFSVDFHDDGINSVRISPATPINRIAFPKDLSSAGLDASQSKTASMADDDIIYGAALIVALLALRRAWRR